MSEIQRPGGMTLPAARLLVCPSVVCRRNAISVFLYAVRQNALGDQLLACLSCGYEAVLRQVSGQFEPRPGQTPQDWCPPRRLDEDVETRRLMAPPDKPTDAQLTITSTSKEEDLQTMNSQKMNARRDETRASSEAERGDARDQAASTDPHRPTKTISLKQMEANRRNALLSTGPKSPEGRVRVGQNAVKHGLLSRVALLPYEDAAVFEEFAKALWADWQPIGAQEEVLVEQVVQAAWRLRRLGQAEAGLFALQSRSSSEQPTAAAATGALGLVFTGNSQAALAFPTLSRYEAGIERTYYRALHELQHLQHARRGGAARAALVANVNVTGGSADSPA